MTYSVLVLGATGLIGSKIAKDLSLHKIALKRVAFLTPTAMADPQKESKYAEVPLERVRGGLDNKDSYKGFEIVISAVGDALCGKQSLYIDAAIAGGVKHFYPAEYGADLDRDGTYQERYFADKLTTRRHVEKRAAAYPDFGYTLIMTGIFSDFFIEKNVLGLSGDGKSAVYTGAPQNRLSTTHSDDVARLVVASLLPSHLGSLGEKRGIRFAGETLSLFGVFETVGKVLGHGVEVTWISKRENLEREVMYLEKGDLFMYNFSSAARSMGLGGSELDEVRNGEFPEIKARRWEDSVREVLGGH